MTTREKTIIEDTQELIQSNMNIQQARHQSGSDPFWKSLRSAGTEVWLDTGDIDAAKGLWSSEMTALTTNNTLLNREVQKGMYDDFIKEANKAISKLDKKERIMEIAFMLNARHGLRLVQELGAMVSVELHTDLSFDLEGIVHYGKRFHAISPDHFYVKVPYTPVGLLGARKLHELGIPVNLTLGFSARHNILAAAVAKPNYVNVFLGRLNSFVADNDLGDGENVGEKATLASQRAVRRVRKEFGVRTKQIAASMRNGKQVELLSGVDVMTMPTSCATEAHELGSKLTFRDRTDEDYRVALASNVDAASVRIDTLWDIDDKYFAFARDLDKNPPRAGNELVQRAHDAGLGEMFPRMSEDDLDTIAADGKIPDFKKWQSRIQSGEVAVDTLMNRAGLAYFASDQAELDKRVTGLIG